MYSLFNRRNINLKNLKVNTYNNYKKYKNSINDKIFINCKK